MTLSPFIRAGTSASVTTVTTGAGPDRIDQAHLYTLLERPFALEEWTRFYRGKATLTKAAEDYLLPFFGGGFVVGFELPDTLTQWFSRVGIPFLDFCICPLQFMDDIALAMRSNSDTITARLTSFGLSKEQCFAYAAMVKATLKHAADYRPPTPEALQGSATLFCAGYHKDRNLAADGRFWTYRDFTDEVLRLARQRPHSWFKPHPWAGTTPEDDAFFSGAVHAQVTRRNVYETLSVAPNLSVVSLCSSTSLEAEFFGHSGINLVGPPAKLFYTKAGTVPKGEERVTVLHDYWDSSFWAHLFGVRLSRGSRVMLDRRPNRLRSIIGFFGPAVATDLVPQHRAIQGHLD
jgi:hypothetical protein